VRAAAEIALAGMDPDSFLEEEDSTKRLVMQQVASKVFELQRALDQSRAIMIANAVGKTFGGK
jgi:hypothetical protein